MVVHYVPVNSLILYKSFEEKENKWRFLLQTEGFNASLKTERFSRFAFDWLKGIAQDHVVFHGISYFARREKRFMRKSRIIENYDLQSAIDNIASQKAGEKIISATICPCGKKDRFRKICILQEGADEQILSVDRCGVYDRPYLHMLSVIDIYHESKIDCKQTPRETVESYIEKEAAVSFNHNCDNPPEIYVCADGKNISEEKITDAFINAARKNNFAYIIV